MFNVLTKMLSLFLMERKYIVIFDMTEDSLSLIRFQSKKMRWDPLCKRRSVGDNWELTCCEELIALLKAGLRFRKSSIKVPHFSFLFRQLICKLTWHPFIPKTGYWVLPVCQTWHPRNNKRNLNEVGGGKRPY